MIITQIEVYKTRRGKKKSAGFRLSAYFEYIDGTSSAHRDISLAFAQVLTEAMQYGVAGRFGHVHMQVNGFIWVLPGGVSILDVVAH